MPAESLLSGTHAITKGEIEMQKYHDRILVRFRNLAGYAVQRQFGDRDEAHRFFIECFEKLKAEIKERKWCA